MASRLRTLRPAPTLTTATESPRRSCWRRLRPRSRPGMRPPRRQTRTACALTCTPPSQTATLQLAALRLAAWACRRWEEVGGSRHPVRWACPQQTASPSHCLCRCCAVERRRRTHRQQAGSQPSTRCSRWAPSCPTRRASASRWASPASPQRVFAQVGWTMAIHFRAGSPQISAAPTAHTNGPLVAPAPAACCADRQGSSTTAAAAAVAVSRRQHTQARAPLT
mmetsp:Transcript_16383/g.48824  ORF Transcript_16383/g.48824 Transcript_16383/m.48824 type:complete len:223 (-) Transcript_16383:653-1321(-)